MKIKRKKLARYLKKIGSSFEELVETMTSRIDRRVELLCNFRRLNRSESARFIEIMGADYAMKFIDWEAMKIGKPSSEAIFGYAN